jgi:hypothetical protein
VKLRVVGMEEIATGVLKVSFVGKGHKGFENKVYAYFPIEDIGKYAFGSEWIAPLAPVVMVAEVA